MSDKITFDAVWQKVTEIVHRINHGIDAVEDNAVDSKSGLHWDDEIEILIDEHIFPNWTTMFGYPNNIAIQTARATIIYDRQDKGFSAKFGPTVIIDRDIFLLSVSRNMMVDFVDLLLEQMPLFRELSPTYHDYRIMGVVAGLTVEEDIARHAMNQGLFVIVPSGNTVRIANQEGFTPRVW
ncbi:MAG: hypothetical protein HQL76_09875 [Magnetococcales bacterium]|nr:hypothetical protein [Magnetococcales bacterium]